MRPSRLELLALIAIFALAAALRLGWVGVNSFAFDEARLSLIALDMAHGGAFASVGMPSSAGVPNLPGAAWVFALPYAVSPDPLVATQFVGVASLLTVTGVWALARRAWGAWAGLAAAVFMAASPYSVLYARSIWAQNLLPALGLLWLWTAYVGIAERKRQAVGAHVFIAGFAVQVHFAGAALALATLYLFFRFRWWRRIVPVLIGGGAALLALVPFILALVNTPALAEQFRAALNEPSQIDLTSVGELIRLATHQGWAFLALGDLDTLSASAFTAVGIGVALAAGLVGLVCFVSPHPKSLSLRERGFPSPASVGESLKLPLSPLAWERGAGGERKHILAELTLVLLLAAPIFFLRHSAPVLIHYLLPTLPALGLVIGAGVTLIRHRAWKIGTIALLTLVAIVWTAQLADSLTRAGQVATPHGLGTPLGVTRHAAYSVDMPVLLFTHGDDPTVDGEAAVFSVLWWGREHRIVQGESLLILPPYPATLMATLAPFQAWEELEASGLADNARTFPRRDGEGEPFIAVRYDGVTAPAGFIPLDPIRFADGTQLEGWRVRRVGPRLRVSTLWRVVEPSPPGTYQQFHHLHPSPPLPVNGEGEQAPLQGADVPISVHNLQVGDRLIVMGDFFHVPPGDYQVDVGHYTLPDVARVPHSGGSDVVRLDRFHSNAN